MSKLPRAKDKEGGGALTRGQIITLVKKESCNGSKCCIPPQTLCTKHQTYFGPQTWIVPFQCGNCSFRLKFYLVIAFPHRARSRRSRIGRTFFLATSSQADEGEKYSRPFLAEPREVSLVGPTNKRNDQNETNEAKKTKRPNYSWFIN